MDFFNILRAFVLVVNCYVYGDSVIHGVVSK